MQREILSPCGMLEAMLLTILSYRILESHAQETINPSQELTDKELLDELLNSEKYDKRIRPKNITNIYVNILLHSLSSPDESSLNYEVEFLLYRKWEDPRLRYDDQKNRFPYLNGLSHVNSVWLPTTYIVKHGSLKEPLVDMSLRIYGNGTVLHILRRGISINCQGNLKIFPFDNPKCPFAIESVALEEDEMQLLWSKENLPLIGASSLQSFNAYLVESEIGQCGDIFTWRGNYSCLHVLLVFTRDKNFYFSTVFVPDMILVSSAFISFWLDKNVVPARVMLGVTTMLSFCTSTNNFRSSLPVVSSLTAMNLWDGVCMFFIYTSLLEFVFVNYLGRKFESRQNSQNHICKKCGKVGSCQVVPEVQSRNSLTGKPDSEEESKIEDNSRFAWVTGHSRMIGMQIADRDWSDRIEDIAKVIFPSLFIIFILIYFVTFAAILPSQYDNWNIDVSRQKFPIKNVAV